MTISPSHGTLTLLMVGRTSHIALTTATTMARFYHLHVVLAAQPGPWRDRAHDMLTNSGCDVETVDFDANRPGQSAAALGHVFDARAVDVAIIVQGEPPDQNHLENDPVAASQACTINYTSTVVTGLLLAQRMTVQGHGVIVAVSSVATVRPAVDYYLDGSLEAGLEVFYTGLRRRLHRSGVRVLIARPGHVDTRMTATRGPGRFAVNPDSVAGAILSHHRAGHQRMWLPTALRPLVTMLSQLPGPRVHRDQTGLSASSWEPTATLKSPMNEQATRKALR